MKEREFLGHSTSQRENLWFNFRKNVVLDLSFRLKSIISLKAKLSRCLIKHQAFDLNVHYLNCAKSYLRILNLKSQIKNYELA